MVPLKFFEIDQTQNNLRKALLSYESWPHYAERGLDASSLAAKVERTATKLNEDHTTTVTDTTRVHHRGGSPQARRL